LTVALKGGLGNLLVIHELDLLTAVENRAELSAALNAI
jgi:hypothetical protein